MLPAVAAISKGKVAKAFLPFYLFTLLPLKMLLLSSRTAEQLSKTKTNANAFAHKHLIFKVIKRIIEPRRGAAPRLPVCRTGWGKALRLPLYDVMVYYEIA